jgi:DNA-binding CsgD family transcriptional regulator
MSKTERLRGLVLNDDSAVAYSKIYPDVMDRLLKAVNEGDPTMLGLGDSVLHATEMRVDAFQALLLQEFGLTAAEIQVVGALCQGDSAAAIAEARAVSVTTVRNQIKSVMAKVGVHRQSELLARFRPYL